MPRQRDRVTNVEGGGSFARGFFPKLRYACDEVGATAGLLTMGVADSLMPLLTMRGGLHHLPSTRPPTYGRSSLD